MRAAECKQADPGEAPEIAYRRQGETLWQGQGNKAGLTLVGTEIFH